MGVPRTPFLAVIAIPAILSTASFLLLFYAVWVEQFAFRLYNKLYIRKYSGAGIVDDCLALYRVRLPWVCAAAGQWGRCEEGERRQRMRKRTKNSRGLSKRVPSALLFFCLKLWRLRCGLQRTACFICCVFTATRTNVSAVAHACGPVPRTWRSTGNPAN